MLFRSPEVLSETSSLASYGSGGSVKMRGGLMAVGGYQRLTASVARLDPIKQSPLRPIHCRGYCLLLDATSTRHPDDPGNILGCVVLSPSAESLTQSKPSRISDTVDNPTCDSRATNVPDKQIETPVEAFIEHGSSPQCSPTPFQTVVNAEVHRNIGTPLSALDVGDEMDPLPFFESPGKLDGRKDILAVGPGLFSGDITSGVITDRSDTTALTEATFDGIAPSCTVWATSDTDSRTSVDSAYGQQYLYDPYVGHYSAAGRGYPHGFFPFPMFVDRCLNDEHVGDEHVPSLPNRMESPGKLSRRPLRSPSTVGNGDGCLTRYVDNSFVSYMNELEPEVCQPNCCHPTSNSIVNHQDINNDGYR